MHVSVGDLVPYMAPFVSTWTCQLAVQLSGMSPAIWNELPVMSLHATCLHAHASHAKCTVNLASFYTVEIPGLQSSLLCCPAIADAHANAVPGANICMKSFLMLSICSRVTCRMSQSQAPHPIALQFSHKERMTLQQPLRGCPESCIQHENAT